MLKFAGKTYIFYKTLEIGGGVSEKVKLQKLRWTAVVFAGRFNLWCARNFYFVCVWVDARKRFPCTSNWQQNCCAERKIYSVGRWKHIKVKWKFIEWRNTLLFTKTIAMENTTKCQTLWWNLICQAVRLLCITICFSVRTEKLLNVIPVSKLSAKLSVCQRTQS